jgi:hypothetical protein
VSFEIKALLTDLARQKMAESMATGKSFRVVGFALGNAGHDPLDPTTALAPDPGLEDCQSVVFGPKGISSFTYANNACPVFECFLDYGEAVTLFSSICLIAQIVYSPIPNDPELNETFLFAVATFPQRPKTDLEKLTLSIGIQR